MGMRARQVFQAAKFVCEIAIKKIGSCEFGCIANFFSQLCHWHVRMNARGRINSVRRFDTAVNHSCVCVERVTDRERQRGKEREREKKEREAENISPTWSVFGSSFHLNLCVETHLVGFKGGHLEFF